VSIKRIFIANRGEIALRIMHTCRLMKIESAIGITPADFHMQTAYQADFCHLFENSVLQDTYLNAQVMIDIALKFKCDAIHPGYGFLSENEGFARLCRQSGLIFIGPDEEVIALMGDKIQSRHKVASLGIPLLPSAEHDNLEELQAAARKMTFPLLVKASAGGGGRGMRLVPTIKDLPKALEAARQEALSAFGNGTLYLERYLEKCRHIEVQVLCDSHGKHLHLFERECSIQRRHQKVIEESPSPGCSSALRKKLFTAALKITKAVNYQNAGTVEFLVKDEEYFFLEMNTRLQVEHAVTEMVTGIDIVKLQIDIADGKKLDYKQSDISCNGHAIEARLYAEDPYKEFMPCNGVIKFTGSCNIPAVRLESAYLSGCSVPTEYDAMLAKIVAWDKVRSACAQKLSTALSDYPFWGVTNNRTLILDILQQSDFLNAQTFTSFINDHNLCEKENPLVTPEVIAAILFSQHNCTITQSTGISNPWLDS